MNLVDILKIKYPSADFAFKLIVQDNGEGQYIAQWDNTLGEQPTQEQIDSWQQDSTVQQQYTFNQNKITNQSIYDQLDAIDAKSIRALRTNDTVRLTALETQAAALRAQLLPTS